MLPNFSRRSVLRRLAEQSGPRDLKLVLDATEDAEKVDLEG